MNPYGQWNEQGSSAAPSILGALPSLSVTSTWTAIPDSVTIKFTSFRSTILNSSVVGAQGHTMYRVVTEAQAPACTIVKDNESKSVAMVRWQPNVTVEVRNAVSREVRARDWLRLSEARDHRIMEIGGVQYIWEPRDQFIYLYKAKSSAPRLIARIARMQAEVILELTREAMSLNLLEPALVATALLCSGHNID